MIANSPNISFGACMEYSIERFQEICKLKLELKRHGPNPVRLMQIASLEIQNTSFNDAETTLDMLKAYGVDNECIKSEHSFLSDFLESAKADKPFKLLPGREKVVSRVHYPNHSIT